MSSDLSDRSPEDQAAIRAFAAELQRCTSETDLAVKEARAALPHLVAATRSHGSQAAIVLGWLASCYNGYDAPELSLDSIRQLDWGLRRQLLAVVLATNCGDFSDVEIREAFQAHSAAAYEDLHAVVTGEPDRNTLRALCRQLDPEHDRHTARAVLSVLRSLAGGGAAVDLHSVASISPSIRGDLGRVIAAVLERGTLDSSDLRAALQPFDSDAK